MELSQRQSRQLSPYLAPEFIHLEDHNTHHSFLPTHPLFVVSTTALEEGLGALVTQLSREMEIRVRDEYGRCIFAVAMMV
jgi:hypothetical protein